MPDSDIDEQWLAVTHLPDCTEGCCALGTLENGQTVVFCRLALREVDHPDLLPWRAYQNLCPHQYKPLVHDHSDEKVFLDQHRLLVCHHHHALFDPNNGKCVGGPCVGQSLRELTLREKRGKIWVLVPKSFSLIAR